MSPRTCGWFWKVKIFDRFLRNQAWTLVLKLNLVACSWLKNYFSALCFGWKWRRRWTVKKNGGTDGNGRHAKLIDYDFDFQHQQGSCGRFEQRWRRLLPDGWRLLRSRRRHHGGSVGFRGELCTPFLKFDLTKFNGADDASSFIVVFSECYLDLVIFPFPLIYFDYHFDYQNYYLS